MTRNMAARDEHVAALNGQLESLQLHVTKRRDIEKKMGALNGALLRETKLNEIYKKKSERAEALNATLVQVLFLLHSKNRNSCSILSSIEFLSIYSYFEKNQVPSITWEN